MTGKLKRQWQALRRSPPGRRFQDRYRAAQGRAEGRRPGGHILRIALAVVALGIGVVLAVLPGPAILFFFLAGALLASESLIVARALDGSEVRLRKIWTWLKRRWAALSGGGKAAAVITLVLLSGGSAVVVSCRWMFG